MAIAREIYKSERIIPLRFSRCADPTDPSKDSGPPNKHGPDLDDRGCVAGDDGPVLGIMEGTSVTVRLTRENIENDAKLFVTSSDTNVVTAHWVTWSELPDWKHIPIDLSAVKGGNPATAKVEVRYGKKDGPILAMLTVRAFTNLEVDVTPHLVTIGQTGSNTPAIGSSADVGKIMDMVKAIWQPCGISFSVGNVRNENVTFAAAGVVSDTPWPGEVNTLLSTNWVPKTINVYFVRRIGNGQTLGYGLSRAAYRRFGASNPGIILADTDDEGNQRDIEWWAHDLAHEFGHFFGLWHPGKNEPPKEWQDTWSRRMLMHNYTFLTLKSHWPDQPRYDDVGCGMLNLTIGGTQVTRGRPGVLITMKNLPRHSTDEECKTSRKTINGRKGPY